MAILGAKAWYHPRWFSRYVPDPDIEGERLDDRLGDSKHHLTTV
jgi:RND superfamily putative drug exporter